MRKRKVTYPVARTSQRPSPAAAFASDAARVRSTVATINLAALDGRTDLKVGDTVRITGNGARAGVVGVFEGLAGGIIPAAIILGEDGRRQRVRLVDLERVAPQQREPEQA